MAPDELLPHIQTNQIHHTRKVLNFYQHKPNYLTYTEKKVR